MAQLYGDRWEVKESLGEGGQAHTFLVIDKNGNSETQYVLKRLKNINRIDRFKREVEAVRNLTHDYIVRLVDFNLEVEPPFLVTEYCLGGSLSHAIPFWRESPIKTLQLFQQTCKGVEYAHRQGIIHRDLKPDNIFLRNKDGPAVVGDFGICFVEENGNRLTLLDEAIGPVNFIAPELEDGQQKTVSAKSDVYSLGKLLYWLLSGGQIFSREKHRQRQWDLKGWNENSLLGWNNIYLEHVNRLLDLMIIDDPEKRRDLSNILILTERVIPLIQKEYNPISKTIRQPCTYCGQGVYILKADNEPKVLEFGFSANNNSNWRIMVCNTCGHVQSFRVDMANQKEWWE